MMITCPVCQAANDDFAVICFSCRGFLQNRIPNLDLFNTAWNVLQSPRRAFQEITLADHKNYCLVLFSVFGVSLSFTGFWFFKLGERYVSLLDLIVSALLIGVALGLLLAPLTAVLHLIGARLLGGKTTFRNSLAVTAYSLTPVVFSLIFVLPIELLTFGMYLFTSNPHPFAIKPISYATLVGFDVVVGLWSVALAVLGTIVSQRLVFLRSLIVVLFLFLALTGLLYYGGLILLSNFHWRN